MDTILIAGVDTVIGANLAALLADRFHAIGIPWAEPVAVDGCESTTGFCGEADFLTRTLAAVRPQWAVACGPGADSTWLGGSPKQDAAALQGIPPLATAARECGARFTLLSSDAVFTGPWMFHDEHSQGYCASEQAQAVRRLERTALEACPEALVVRTHVVGFSPLGERGGLERLLADLEARRAREIDCRPHATPIPAGELAEILAKAYRQGLSGVFHIAGAERTNSVQFARRLADQFGLPQPSTARVGSLAEPSRGFGRGETSLHSAAVRRELGVSVPTLAEGLARLHAQYRAGICQRFRGPAPLRDKAA